MATATVWLIVTYDLFLSTTNFHNNRAYLVIVLAALAVTPCGRELSVDAWLRRRRGGPPRPTMSPAWPLWLLRFEASTVYGASGLSKLLDHDWFGGTVTWHRVVRTRAPARRVGAAGVGGGRADGPLVPHRSAKVIIATELFIAVGLWSRRTRYAAVWVAVCFHVAIQLSARVEVFSYLAIAALVIWSVPSTRDRVLRDRPADRATAASPGRRRARLAGPLPHRAGAPGAPFTRRRPRRAHRRRAVARRAMRSAGCRSTAWFALPDGRRRPPDPPKEHMPP